MLSRDETAPDRVSHHLDINARDIIADDEGSTSYHQFLGLMLEFILQISGEAFISICRE
jgi:hypothetical protein